jgi:hypothetical protein
MTSKAGHAGGGRCKLVVQGEYQRENAARDQGPAPTRALPLPGLGELGDHEVQGAEFFEIQAEKLTSPTAFRSTGVLARNKSLADRVGTLTNTMGIVRVLLL